MMRIGCVLLFWIIGRTCLQSANPTSPVLMHINGKAVTLAEFQQACQTCGPSFPKVHHTLQAQLDWFIDRKLKAAEAEEAGLDTLPAIRSRLDRYRNALAQIYLTDAQALESATRQRYEQLRAKSPSGRVWVQHIFRRLSQNISPTALRQAELQMDSLYHALCQGAPFETLAQRYSDEKEPFRISRLQMPAEFEETAFTLQPGTFSAPFFTPQGIHIVLVLRQEPLPPFEQVKERLVREQAINLSQSQAATSATVERLKQTYRLTPDAKGLSELHAQGHTSLPLFTIDGKTYSGSDFALFATAHPGSISCQLEGFISKSVLDHAHHCLEQQPAIGIRLQVYRDSLLASAIERQNEQLPASEQELQAYFKKNRAHYRWKHPRYKGVVLHGATKHITKQARKFLKRLPKEEWADAIRMTFPPEQSEVRAEIGLFALGDNAYVDELVFKQGDASPLPAFPFTAVVGKKLKGPENYREVYEQLVSDYRNEQEKRRMARMYAQCKVEINQEVLKTVNNQ